MKLSGKPPVHLTYCLNVHPGESWGENLEDIRTHALRVKAFLCPGASFGLGLRLGERAARELAEPTTLARFRDLLTEHDLYVFTINGFPYGTFHRTAVKSDVYKPDWRTVERRDYTNLLADLLAELLPEDVTGSISTVPGSYKSWVQTSDDRRRMLRMLSASAAHLAEIRYRTGREISLALEPEPDCVIENTDEALAFFAEAPDETFRRHVGVCVDLCHLAVAFEDPADSMRRLVDAGVRVSKVQLSSALRCAPTDEAIAALAAFRDPVYLHQVKVRTADGAVLSYADLSEALERRAEACSPDEEWRVHFHVPLFLSAYGALESTRSLYTPELARMLTDGVSEHLEIETYTFDVLPEGLREPDVAESIAREFEWVLSYLKR